MSKMNYPLTIDAINALNQTLSLKFDGDTIDENIEVKSAARKKLIELIEQLNNLGK